MRFIQQYFYSIICLVILSGVIGQIQAQLAGVNYPCGHQIVNSPNLTMYDLRLDGMSIYGLTSVYVTPGTSHTVEFFFTTTLTGMITASGHFDFDNNGVFIATEMLGSATVPASSGYAQFSFTPTGPGFAIIPGMFVLDPDASIATTNPCSSLSRHPINTICDINPNQLLYVSSDPDPQGLGQNPWEISQPSEGICLTKRDCYGDILSLGFDMTGLSSGDYRLKVMIKEQEFSVSPAASHLLHNINRTSNCDPTGTPESYINSNTVNYNGGSNTVEFDLDLGFFGSDLPSNYTSAWNSNATAPPYVRMYVEMFETSGNNNGGGNVQIMFGQESNPDQHGTTYERNLWFCEEGNAGGGEHRRANPVSNESQGTSFQAIPNPVNHRLFISYDLTAKSDVQLRIMDLQGQVVAQIEQMNRNTGSYQEQIDVSKLPAGMYLLQMTTKDGIQTQRVLKQ